VVAAALVAGHEVLVVVPVHEAGAGFAYVLAAHLTVEVQRVAVVSQSVLFGEGVQSVSRDLADCLDLHLLAVLQPVQDLQDGQQVELQLLVTGLIGKLFGPGQKLTH
jgi:hypothetical protein